MMFGLGPIEIFLALVILGFTVTIPIGVVLIFLHARKPPSPDRADAAPAGPTCPKCAAPVASGAWSCSQCGAELTPRSLF